MRQRPSQGEYRPAEEAVSTPAIQHSPGCRTGKKPNMGCSVLRWRVQTTHSSVWVSVPQLQWPYKDFLRINCVSTGERAGYGLPLLYRAKPSHASLRPFLQICQLLRDAGFGFPLSVFDERGCSCLRGLFRSESPQSDSAFCSELRQCLPNEFQFPTMVRYTV